ncbi:MAG: copper resistance system multicopper oxidase [Motiliproteus sp.]
MRKTPSLLRLENASVSRREFVQGIAMGGVVAGLGLRSSQLLASPSAESAVATLRGNQFDLSIDQQQVNFTGATRLATTVNGSLPAPILRWREGEEVTLRVTNHLDVPTSIHWHGIILPTAMDGVPGISFPGIAPGETFTYRFRVQQSGTYWYHSHSGFQEQTGLYGAIVIDPKDKEPIHYDRDYVVQLSDWSDEDPNAVYAKLKKLSHYYNFNERTAPDLWQEIQSKGVSQTWQSRQMWNQMRMSDSDISDVTGYTYTFLMNGQTPTDGWVGLFRKGERVRLRFINSAAMTFFDVRIPGLKMTVIAADGQNVEPVSIDEFRIGVAETFDVIVEPSDDSAYTLFAQAIDRSGYALGTLTPDAATRAEIPAFDPVPVLGHGDMGMDMSSMAGMDHASMGHGAMVMGAMPGMDHSNMAMGAMPGMDHSNMAMGAMPGMDHSTMEAPRSMEAQGMSMEGLDMSGMSMKEMDMSDINMTTMTNRSPSMSSSLAPTRPVQHAPTEYGPHVDMRADNPSYRLDDPGVGLRNNGRRVLTYADLMNRYPTLDAREPSREIELHLTGNMSRYMWSMNGVKFADADPLQLKYGERVRITLVNDTMMNHPMHLHGMWSDLETGDLARIPRKHTVVVQPGARISYQVTADARGDWAYHCHLIYHMLGMFRQVTVS